MSTSWIVVLATSALAFALKFLGHLIPESFLERPRVERITNFIPIVLLSALIAMQTFTDKTKLVIDHRLAGIAVALAAVIAKLPFPVVIIGAMATSALVYRYKL
jgi:branched-subunit amino acid transport protein